jgi:hypothetical protein
MQWALILTVEMVALDGSNRMLGGGMVMTGLAAGATTQVSFDITLKQVRVRLSRDGATSLLPCCFKCYVVTAVVVIERVLALGSLSSPPAATAAAASMQQHGSESVAATSADARPHTLRTHMDTHMDAHMATHKWTHVSCHLMQLALTNADGDYQLYSGDHLLLVETGVGGVAPVQVPLSITTAQIWVNLHQ